jgi:hypothetical protein
MAGKVNPGNIFCQPVTQQTVQRMAEKLTMWAQYLSQNPESRCGHRKRSTATIGAGFEMVSALVPTGKTIVEDCYFFGTTVPVEKAEFYCTECGKHEYVPTGITSFEEFAKTFASVMGLAVNLVDLDPYYRMAVQLNSVKSGQDLVLSLIDGVGSWNKAQGLEYLKDMADKARLMAEEAKLGGVAIVSQVDASVIAKAITVDANQQDVYSYIKVEQQPVVARDLFTSEQQASAQMGVGAAGNNNMAILGIKS